MKRAAALIAVMERVEDEVVSQSVVRLLLPNEVKLLEREVVRTALAVFFDKECSGLPRALAEADAARARLEAEIAALRSAMRLRDFNLGAAVVDAAASALRLPVDPASRTQVDRAAVGALLEVKEAELAVDDGATVAAATRDIRDRRFSGRDISELTPPILLSAAIAAGCECAVSLDMRRKIEATGHYMLAFFGDVPLDLVTQEELLKFLLWLRRLPNGHGKAHGRNKYEAVSQILDKHMEIAEADAFDEKIRAEISARKDLSLREMRAELARRLAARMTDGTAEKHHARVAGIFKAAKKLLKWDGPEFTSVLPDFRTEAKTADNRADPLELRVTQPKQREVWSNSRIAALFTSSIYRGCTTVHRRWKPGSLTSC